MSIAPSASYHGQLRPALAWLKSLSRALTSGLSNRHRAWSFGAGSLWSGIKTLRPLAEALREKYPEAVFSIITNGSLLTLEINEWLDRMGFCVGLSHDGPGQHVRGPDPLADPEKREAILDLYRRLAASGRMSFNAMMNRNNVSRAAVAKFFVELTGDPNVRIGEGTFVDAYDELAY